MTYTPDAFRLADEEALAIVDAHPFGLLVTPADDGCLLTHVPFQRNGGRLVGHLASANPHARFLDGPATAVFTGAHAYVSPRWYASVGFNVPTWNYEAVHVSGRCRTIADRTRRRQAIDELVARYEGGEWEVDWADARSDTMLDGIRVFELAIEHVAGKSKMSQNRSPQDIDSIADRLSGTQTPGAPLVAEIMRRRRDQRSR
jgi:transcriptional regulator